MRWQKTSVLANQISPTLTTPKCIKYHKIIFLHAYTNEPLYIRKNDYRPSLMSDIQSTTLMISHAGAGSIMEGLEQHKKLLVVINPTLMNNHQSELAGALSSRGYLWHLDSPEKFSDNNYHIVRKIDALPKENIKMWPKGDEWAFPTFLDAFMGCKDTSKSQ